MQKRVVAIFGVPRTGTSWLGEIFDSSEDVIYKYQPLFSYTFKDRITVHSSSEEIQHFFDELAVCEDDFLDQQKMRDKGYYPTFEKKTKEGKILAFKEVRYLYLIPHLLESIEDIKVVMISRDALEMMESWINAPSEFHESWDIYREWYFAPSKNKFRPENYYGYAKWKESQALFYQISQCYADRAILIHYEDLCEDAFHVMERVFVFCGLEMREQTKNFIRQSQSETVSDAYGVYRKKGSARIRHVYLPEDIKRWIRTDQEEMERRKIIE